MVREDDIRPSQTRNHGHPLPVTRLFHLSLRSVLSPLARSTSLRERIERRERT